MFDASTMSAWRSQISTSWLPSSWR